MMMGKVESSLFVGGGGEFIICERRLYVVIDLHVRFANHAHIAWAHWVCLENGLAPLDKKRKCGRG